MKKFFVGLVLALAVLACFGCSGAVEPERFETKTVTLFDLTSIYQYIRMEIMGRTGLSMRVINIIIRKSFLF